MAKRKGPKSAAPEKSEIGKAEELTPKGAPRDDGDAVTPTEPGGAGADEAITPDARADKDAEAREEMAAPEPAAKSEAEREEDPLAALRWEEPPAYDAQEDEPAHDDHAHAEHHHEDEHGQRTLATTALFALIGIIVIASLTLWIAPKVAPHLPAGIAQYLTPGQVNTQSRLTELEAALAAQSAETEAAIAAANEQLATQIAALSSRLETTADAGVAEAAIAAAQSAADAAAAEAAALAARLDAIEGDLSGLREEFSALSVALADAGDGEGAASPEIAAAVAALGARLDKLAATVAGKDLETQLAALSSRLEVVESSAADARDVQTEALGEVSTAIRQARLQAAVDLLTSRLAGGLPYAAKLREISELSGAEAPAALAASAEAGLATAASLEASFGRHAHDAIAADVQASTDDGKGLQVLGWLKAQVAGRPTTEQEGESVGAITSRIGARIEEGKLVEALAEAETLPEHAKLGLGRWLDQLRARVGAEAALADWRTEIGAGG